MQNFKTYSQRIYMKKHFMAVILAATFTLSAVPAQAPEAPKGRLKSIKKQLDESLDRFKRCMRGKCTGKEKLKVARDVTIAAITLLAVVGLGYIGAAYLQAQKGRYKDGTIVWWLDENNKRYKRMKVVGFEWRSGKYILKKEYESGDEHREYLLSPEQIELAELEEKERKSSSMLSSSSSPSLSKDLSPRYEARKKKMGELKQAMIAFPKGESVRHKRGIDLSGQVIQSYSFGSQGDVMIQVGRPGVEGSHWPIEYLELEEQKTASRLSTSASSSYKDTTDVQKVGSSLSSEKSKPQPLKGFKVGDRVRHKKHGKGVVESIVFEGGFFMKVGKSLWYVAPDDPELSRL